MIRANQGHSVDVDVELEKVILSQLLWNGTAEKHVRSIEENGLIPKTRLCVHLSSDIDTARKVGARHGEVVVYRVDALKTVLFFTDLQTSPVGKVCSKRVFSQDRFLNPLHAITKREKE